MQALDRVEEGVDGDVVDLGEFGNPALRNQPPRSGSSAALS
jgi:hypothetical protein